MLTPNNSNSNSNNNSSNSTSNSANKTTGSVFSTASQAPSTKFVPEADRRSDRRSTRKGDDPSISKGNRKGGNGNSSGANGGGTGRKGKRKNGKGRHSPHFGSRQQQQLQLQPPFRPHPHMHPPVNPHTGHHHAHHHHKHGGAGSGGGHHPHQQHHHHHQQHPHLSHGGHHPHHGAMYTRVQQPRRHRPPLTPEQSAEQSKQLERALRQRGCAPELSPHDPKNDDTIRRRAALDMLESIVNDWCVQVERTREEATVTSNNATATATTPLTTTTTSARDENASIKDTKRTKPFPETEGISEGATLKSPGLLTSSVKQVPFDDRSRVAIITFGSFRLGVHRPDSDIDVLALSPPSCSRDDFFGSLVDILKQHPSAEDVHPIASAFTPVIKFILDGFHIDLLFGRVEDPAKLVQYHKERQRRRELELERDASSKPKNRDPARLEGLPAIPFPQDAVRIPEGGDEDDYVVVGDDDTNDYVVIDGEEKDGDEDESSQEGSDFDDYDITRFEYTIDDSDLAGMDEAGVRSLNGARVSQMLVEMVPNIEHYRVTLRAVKEWATVHGVYSNVLGFLGGINFAILVAWICIRCPDDKPTALLRVFFRTYAMWQWPAALTLTEIQSQPPPGVPPMPVWDPQANPRDRLHIMPIITPAYPSMNSTYNVGFPQLRRISEEMVRAALLLDESEENWRVLFQGSDFFRRHANFLQITIQAANSEDFFKWLRLCESKLRLLIVSLETPQVSAWPFTKIFKRTARGSTNDSDGYREAHFFIALRFAPGVEIVNLRYSTSDFLYRVNSWEERKDGMDLSIAHIVQEDLPRFVFAPDRPKVSSNSSVGSSSSRSTSKSKKSTKSSKDEDTPCQTTLTPPNKSQTILSDDITSPTKRARSDNII